MGEEHKIRVREGDRKKAEFGKDAAMGPGGQEGPGMDWTQIKEETWELRLEAELKGLGEKN